MKKQFLIVLMLGIVVGQIQGAESSGSDVTIGIQRNEGTKRITGGTVFVKDMKGETVVSEKTFPLDQTKASIANRWDANQTSSEERLEILKKWFPDARELQKVNKLKIIEQQKEEPQGAEEEVKRLAAQRKREAEEAKQEALHQKALQEEAIRKAIREQKLSFEKEEVRKKEALRQEELRKAREAEEARKKEEARQEALRKAEEKRRAEEAERIRMEQVQKEIEEEEMAAALLEEFLATETRRVAEEARLEEERVAALEQLRIAEEIRIQQEEAQRVVAVEEELRRQAEEEQALMMAAQEEEAERLLQQQAEEEQALMMAAQEEEAEAALKQQEEDEKIVEEQAVLAQQVRLDEARGVLRAQAQGAATVEQQAVVVTQIPGFFQLSLVSQKVLTPHAWEMDSTRYYIAVIAVQQVLNYVFALAGERPLGDPHLDNKDVVGSHFMAMYGQMLNAGQIKTEFDLKDQGVQADINQALDAIVQLNQNFRGSAVSDIVLDFEGTLPGMPTRGIVADVTRLPFGQSLELGDPRGEAFGGAEFISLSGEEVSLIFKIYQYVLDSDPLMAKDPQALSNLAKRKEMLIEFVKERPRVLQVSPQQIASLLSKERMQFGPEVVHDTHNEIQRLGSNLSASVSPAMARKPFVRKGSTVEIDEVLDNPESARNGKLDEWGKRLSDIVELVRLETLLKDHRMTEEEFMRALSFDEQQRSFLEYRMQQLVGEFFEGAERLNELMQRFGVRHQDKEVISQFVNDLKKEKIAQQTQILSSLAQAAQFHFTVEKDSKGKVFVQDMPDLTQYLTIIGPKIKGVGNSKMTIAFLIKMEGSNWSRGIGTELRGAASVTGRPISRDEIRKMLGEFYKSWGERGLFIKHEYLDALAMAIYNLQFNHQGIHINPDEGPLSPQFSATSESTIARVLQEYKKQQETGFGSGLTDIMEENKQALKQELWDLRAGKEGADRWDYWSPEQIREIINKSAQSLGKGGIDEGDLGYFARRLNAFHREDGANPYTYGDH